MRRDTQCESRHLACARACSDCKSSRKQESSMFSRSIRFASGLALSLALVSPDALLAPAKAHQPITVRWLGHAAFEVTSSGGTRILIDPFISGNPSTPD